MQSRRIFIGKMTGLAGTLAARPTCSGASDRIRIGLIGAGDRGRQILREAIGCPNVECAGIADVYSKRLEEGEVIAPNARTWSDYRALLDDQSIDAVLIATPQHLHAEHFVAALDAGKHVYQEKTMAFTVDAGEADARRRTQRATAHGADRPPVDLVRARWPTPPAFLKPELMGRITAIHAHMYRNTPHGKPQWARPVYPDMTPENIAWNAFLGEAPRAAVRPRPVTSTGGSSGTTPAATFIENMCHQLAFWYKTLGLRIPRTASS